MGARFGSIGVIGRLEGFIFVLQQVNGKTHEGL